METFLTCLYLLEFMRDRIDESNAVGLEQISLKAIHLTFFTNVNFVDINLLIAELPKILKFNYPVVDDILQDVLRIIPQLKSIVRNLFIGKWGKWTMWEDFCELDYIFELLKTFETCRKK